MKLTSSSPYHSDKIVCSSHFANIHRNSSDFIQSCRLRQLQFVQIKVCKNLMLNCYNWSGIVIALYDFEGHCTSFSKSLFVDCWFFNIILYCECQHISNCYILNAIYLRTAPNWWHNRLIHKQWLLSACWFTYRLPSNKAKQITFIKSNVLQEI